MMVVERTEVEAAGVPARAEARVARGPLSERTFGSILLAGIVLAETAWLGGMAYLVFRLIG